MANEDLYAEMTPVYGEEKYVEYDEEFGQWGIFGAQSGFCYVSCCSKEVAEKQLNPEYDHLTE
jgi:hypothetical protein